MAQTVSFQAHATSDLAELKVDEYLNFRAVKLKYGSEAPISQLKTPGRFKGIVLSIHLTTDDTHTVQGCAVMVAPGVALCASHVLRGDVERLLAGELRALIVGRAEHGDELWNLRNVTFVPNTEVCILSLSLICGLPADRTFHQASISTRWPRKGERLVLTAFKAEEEDCIKWKPGEKIRSYTLACAGKVTQHFSQGRGRMLPGPCLEVDFESWHGMSGGPVFDEDGWLVGVLSVSMSSQEGNAPSFVSMASSALAYPFPGGWFRVDGAADRALLAMLDPECVIERREMVKPKYMDDGSVEGCTIVTWHDR